jgi:hypothetical protein
LGFAILQFDNLQVSSHTKSVGKTSSFVFATILGIAFFVSVGSVYTRADIDKDDQSILDRPEYDEEHPWYQVAPSRWSVGLRVAIDSFPFQSGIGNNYQVYGEWVLPFQKAGLFSVGGHISTVPLNIGSRGLSTASVPYPNFLSMLGGLQARYQLRLMKNQFLVPTAALEWDYFRIVVSKDRNEDSIGSVFGASFGVMVNLGWIDRGTAREAYATLGMTRTYLTLEVRPFTVNTSTLKLTGNFFFSGLRFEFE